MLTGTVITGAVVSTTVTVNVAIVVLPWPSAPTHDTVVAPSGNVEPLAGAQTTAIAPLTLSIADAVNVNGAPEGTVASTVALSGTVTTGFTESITVTMNDAVPVFACASVAVQVTVVAPIRKTARLAGVQLGSTGPSMLSVAVALNVSAAPPGPLASSVASDGTVTTGGVTSTSFTVTLKLPATSLPARSLAEHCTVVVPIANREPLSGEHITGCSRST